ncbi:MAG: tail fiber domain-containing protein [Verrucomicrobiota bacterium]
MKNHSSDYVPCIRTLRALTLMPLLVLAFSLQPSALLLASPLGTAFTYQGRLSDGANTANGIYDLRFTVYDDSSGPGLMAGPLTNSSFAVSNGLFTVTLDFGQHVFAGEARWLEIGVRSNGVGADFTTLSPRQALTPAPYALHAGGVDATGIMGTITPASIAAGSITTVMLAAGAVGSNQLSAGAVTTAALQSGAVTAVKMASAGDSLVPTIPNPTPAAYDNFGRSVAAVGRARVLIGAPFDTTGGTNAGAAYLFSTDGTLLTTFTKPTLAAYDYFGWSVAAVGSDRVLIGAQWADSGTGAAYLFSTDGRLLTTFTNPSPAVAQLFGSAVVGLGNDRVLIGTDGDEEGLISPGAAYLFRSDGTLLTTFSNPHPEAGGKFGAAVAAVSSDCVLIGAYNTWGHGLAYLFSTNGTVLATFMPPNSDEVEYFGCAVAAVGADRLVIGAGGVDWAEGLGAAYLFSTNGTLLATCTNPAPVAGDRFGCAVAGVGTDRVLVGANAYAGYSGVAYLFNTNGALLMTLTNPITATDSFFGYSVAALGSDGVVIGAAGENTGAVHAGAAHLFSFGTSSFGTFTPGLVAEAVRFGGVTADQLDPTIGVWTRAGQNVYRLAGNVGLGTANPGFTLEVNGTAGKPGGGSWSVASDARLKKNIHPLAGALDKLLALRGVNFEYLEPGKIHELSGERMGLVAQEVEKVFPDWVETGPDGFKRVTVRGLEALVVEALRTLQQQKNADIKELNQKMEDTNDALKKEITELKARVRKLDAKVNGGG